MRVRSRHYDCKWKALTRESTMNRISIRLSLDWRSRELSSFKRDMLQDLFDLKAEKRPFPIRQSLICTTDLGRGNINPRQHPPACRGVFGRHVRPPPPAAPHTSTGASVAPLGMPAPVPGKSKLSNSPERIRCLSLPAHSAKTQSRRRSPIGPHGASREMQACLLLPIEYYGYWQTQLPGDSFPSSSFGENFSVGGLVRTGPAGDSISSHALSLQ